MMTKIMHQTLKLLAIQVQGTAIHKSAMCTMVECDRPPGEERTSLYSVTEGSEAVSEICLEGRTALTRSVKMV